MVHRESWDGRGTVRGCPAAESSEGRWRCVGRRDPDGCSGAAGCVTALIRCGVELAPVEELQINHNKEEE